MLPLAPGQGCSAPFNPRLTQHRTEEADRQRQGKSPARLHPSPLISWGNELHLSAVVAMAQAAPHAPYGAAPGEIVTCSTNLLLAQFLEDNTPQTTTESPPETVPSNCPQTDHTTTQSGGPVGLGGKLRQLPGPSRADTQTLGSAGGKGTRLCGDPTALTPRGAGLCPSPRATRTAVGPGTSAAFRGWKGAPDAQAPAVVKCRSQKAPFADRLYIQSSQDFGCH